MFIVTKNGHIVPAKHLEIVFDSIQRAIAIFPWETMADVTNIEYDGIAKRYNVYFSDNCAYYALCDTVW